MIKQRQVPVSEPVFAVIKFLEEMIADSLERKGAAEIQANLLAAIPLLSQLSDIPSDFRADPEAIQNAVYLAADDLVKRLYSILKKGQPANPGES